MTLYLVLFLSALCQRRKTFKNVFFSKIKLQAVEKHLIGLTTPTSLPDRLIGVHCTHGLNRTGYLICRYLIDVDGMEPAAAVQRESPGLVSHGDDLCRDVNHLF